MNNKPLISILGQVDWATISREVSKQQINREINTPVISTFRWWARRPHGLIGALLDASLQVYGHKGLVVADPFSGGGTVTFEAVRRQIPVYSQDLYPWPAFGLYTALSPSTVRDLSNAAQSLLEGLGSLRACYRLPDSERELTHILRVRVGACPHCGTRVYLFPEPLISLVSRRADEQEAYFGCIACGNVERGPKQAEIFRCSVCEKEWSTKRGTGHKVKPFISCPVCSSKFNFAAAFTSPPEWKPVLVQEVSNGKGFIRPVEPCDPIEDEPLADLFQAIDSPIPDGIETRRLLRAGFRSWVDLYTSKQVRILIAALDAIRTMKVEEPVRDRLALAVIGCAEMAGYLSRWDRFHLKAFEALANHRYANTTLAVETNFLSPLGRGTLPRRLRAAEKALAWLIEAGDPKNLQLLQITEGLRRCKVCEGVVVAWGTSVRQAPSSGSIRLVLTDPPYYNDVQYGELGRLFHFWLGIYKGPFKINENEEAVPNRSRSVDAKAYEELISTCLRESVRTLSSDGRMIFTFHNRKIEAWRAICGALYKANLGIMALAVTKAENAADHTKRTRKAFLYDLVLECCQKEDAPKTPKTYTSGDLSEQERNLLAAGLALAVSLYEGVTEIFDTLFEVELDRLGVEERWIN